MSLGRMISIVLCALSGAAMACAEEPLSRILVFSKSSGDELAVSYRDTAWPSLIERELLALGSERHLDFTFTKDGGVFTPDSIAGYDAFLFYTSGDLTRERRDGQGDNYPPMTGEGKAALLRAIHEGKGFVGVHCAMDTFSDEPEPNGADTGEASSYHGMLGARFLGPGELERGHLVQFDRAFPGFQKVPVSYEPTDQWYALRSFRRDLHVIMALDSPRMQGTLYARPSYPIAWARKEGKGRVFYTAMGHTAAIWKDPLFREMLVGAAHWAAGSVDADLTPNFEQSTPRANEIPPAAKSFDVTPRSVP